MVVTVEPGIYIPSDFEDSGYAGPNIKQYVLYNIKSMSYMQSVLVLPRWYCMLYVVFSGICTVEIHLVCMHM